MLVIRHGFPKGESGFEVRDPGEEGHRAVRVHPWIRYAGTNDEDRSVFVSVGNYNPDGSEDRIADEEPVWNIIVDRDEFVNGLLEVFPELTRTNDPA